MLHSHQEFTPLGTPSTLRVATPSREPFAHTPLAESPSLLSRLKQTRTDSLQREASRLVGKKVEIVGTKREELNGKRGDASKADTNSKGEPVYVVTVDGTQMKLKPANLKVIFKSCEMG